VNKDYVCFAVVSFLVLVLFTSTSSACIGMDATNVIINVSPGYSATGHMTIFNNCDTPIDFNTGGDIQPVTNQTTPTLSMSPGIGILTGHQQLTINITITMPANATPGTEWTGGVAAMQISNSSRVGGANLQLGVRTMLTAVALFPPINFYEFELLAIAVIIIIVLVMLLIYFVISKHSAIKKLSKSEKELAATKKVKQARRRRR
jgi:hypothetical protein